MNSKQIMTLRTQAAKEYKKGNKVEANELWQKAAKERREFQTTKKKNIKPTKAEKHL